MKTSTTLTLICLALVTVAAAVLTNRATRRLPPEQTGRILLENAPIASAAILEIHGAEGRATFTRTASGWQATDLFGHPADAMKVGSFIDRLSTMQIGHVIDLDAPLQAKLRLVPPATPDTAPGAIGHLVRFRDANNQTITELLIGSGHRRMTPAAGTSTPQDDGWYVSTDNGRTAYLVSETFPEVSADANDWLHREIVSISSGDIREIIMTGPGRHPLRLARYGKGPEFRLDGLTPNEALDPTALAHVEYALSYLRFTRIVDPGTPDAEMGLVKPLRFEVVVRSGDVYSVEIGASPEGSEDRYVRIRIERPPGRQALVDRTAALKKRLDKWTYLVTSQSVSPMLIDRQRLVKKKERATPGLPPE